MNLLIDTPLRCFPKFVEVHGFNQFQISSQGCILNPGQSWYAPAVAYLTTAVSFKTPDGRLWCHVTMAHSVFEAVREGMKFLCRFVLAWTEAERGDAV